MAFTVRPVRPNVFFISGGGGLVDMKHLVGFPNETVKNAGPRARAIRRTMRPETLRTRLPNCQNRECNRPRRPIVQNASYIEILDEMPNHCSCSDYVLGNYIVREFVSKLHATLAMA